MLDAVAAAGAHDPDEIFDGRVEQPIAPSVPVAEDAQIFDQYEAEHEALAATAPGSTSQPSTKNVGPQNWRGNSVRARSIACVSSSTGPSAPRSRGQNCSPSR